MDWRSLQLTPAVLLVSLLPLRQLLGVTVSLCMQQGRHALCPSVNHLHGANAYQYSANPFPSPSSSLSPSPSSSSPSFPPPLPFQSPLPLRRVYSWCPLTPPPCVWSGVCLRSWRGMGSSLNMLWTAQELHLLSHQWCSPHLHSTLHLPSNSY